MKKGGKNLMAGTYGLTFREYGTKGKTSIVQVWIPNLTAANFAAQQTLWDAFSAAVQDVSIGNLNKEQIVAEENKLSNASSVNVQAQRENKWHVACTEAGTGNNVSFEIPCADLTLIAADGESMDTGSAEYAALVAATEAFVRSNDGNAVTVDRIYYVGRSI